MAEKQGKNAKNSEKGMVQEKKPGNETEKTMPGKPVQPLAPETMPEKKEKPKKKQKIQAKKILTNPVFVSAIAIIIIALGFMALSFSEAPKELGINDFEHANTEKIHVAKIIVLVSEECDECEYDNSFIRTLSENGIVFAAEEYDISSEEGKRIVDWLGVKKIPVVLLDSQTIDDTMKVKTNSGYFTLKDVLDEYLKYEMILEIDDIYIIPEIELDNAPHVGMFIDRESCGTEEKIRVDLYTDPYCLPCAHANATVSGILEKFGDSIDFNYNFFPVDSKKILYTWEKISPWANYSICAARQGKLDNFNLVTYTYYCNPEKQAYDLNSLKHCYESPNFHIPMPIDKIKEATVYARLDIEELGNCFEQIEKDKPKMIETARTLAISEVPVVVVNCRYVTHAEDLERAICKANPSLEECNQ